MAAPNDTQTRINAHFVLGGLAAAAIAMACAGWIWVNHGGPESPPPPLPQNHPTPAPSFVPAVVDMKRIFAAHPATKAMEAKLNASRKVAKREMDDRLSARQQWLDLANGAGQRLERTGIAEAERRDQSNERGRFVDEPRTLEREIAEFKKAREQELRDEGVQARNSIVGEISEVVVSVARRHAVTLLFDASGESLNGMKLVLTAPGVSDLTDEVIAAFAAQTSER